MSKPLTIARLWLAGWGVCFVVAVSTPSYACDPAASYGVKVGVSDAPKCLVVGAKFSDETGTLTIQNNCTELIHIEASVCSACGPGVDIKPTKTESFDIELRKVGKGLTADVPTRQLLSWSSSSAKGTIETTVTWHDTWKACADAKRRSGVDSKSKSKSKDESKVLDDTDDEEVRKKSWFTCQLGAGESQTEGPWLLVIVGLLLKRRHFCGNIPPR